MAGRWRETSPTELAEWLVHVPVAWAFAGGWGLDLWAEQQSRSHSDIEIACLRGNLRALIDALPGFEVAVAQNKQLSPWPADALPTPPFSLWLQRHGETLWDFEIVAEAHEGQTWRYRRDERITLPLDRLFRHIGDGRMVVAPEVQLLYKCKEPRDKDVADLQRFAPMLDPAANAWLREAVAAAHPEAIAHLQDSQVASDSSAVSLGGAIRISS
ncbi:MAG TPA: hypothetical protein VF982_00885 [Anaerolineales bacterium]